MLGKSFGIYGKYFTACVGKREPVQIVYLNFNKSFDEAILKRLTHKLPQCGLELALHIWLQ